MQSYYVAKLEAFLSVAVSSAFRFQGALLLAPKELFIWGQCELRLIASAITGGNSYHTLSLALDNASAVLDNAKPFSDGLVNSI